MLELGSNSCQSPTWVNRDRGGDGGIRRAGRRARANLEGLAAELAAIWIDDADLREVRDAERRFRELLRGLPLGRDRRVVVRVAAEAGRRSLTPSASRPRDRLRSRSAEWSRRASRRRRARDCACSNAAATRWTRR